jgi:FtsP/CotA-like multicopper oxidase with cupredoxin domain
MELESYYDGVAGFGGAGRSITPSIEPGESFNAIFTPPRAGTFIYHTHMDDDRQLQAGLYGAMIISEPGAPYDPEIDKLLVIGLLGFTTPETIGINGDIDYQMTLEAGRTYRLRLINITASNGGFNVTLTSPDEAITWRPVAEDGADLPQLYREPRLAFREGVSVGETFDFEWTPQSGIYWFEVRRGTGEWMAQARIVVGR